MIRFNKKPLLYFFFLLIAVTSCSSRDRDNPFDPLNPNTGGEPFVFNGIADDGRAQLTWTTSDLADLEGYVLVRSVLGGGSPDDTARYELGVNQTLFQDKGLTNGTTYLYNLGFLFDDIPTWTNSDTLTPGSAVPWVLDGYAGVLIRLSPDGRDRASSFSMSSVFSDLDVIPADESAWVSDYFNRKIYHIGTDGVLIEYIEVSGFPVAIAVDEIRARVWVSQTEPAALVRYSGGVRDRYFEMNDYPLSLSIDQESGTLWACSPGGRTVIRVDDAVLNRSSGYDSPRAIVYDPVIRVAWVATRSAVISLNSQFQQVTTMSGFSYPEDIALDMERGYLWIADTGNSRVLKYDRDANHILTVTGLTEPYSVAVDVEKEECWITDSYEGTVIRVSGEGQFIKKKDGFLSPYGIGIIP